MKINRSNYEEYFIDYLDGNLSPEKKEELLDFLFCNPDLKNELEQFSENALVLPEVEFKFKDRLKKDIVNLGEINHDTIDEFCIAFLEGELNDNEKTTFLKEISANNEYKKTYQLYKKTIIQPDKSVMYLHKRKLKHFVLERRTIVRAISYISVAAMLLIGIVMINPSGKIQDNKQISQAIKKIEPVEITGVEATGNNEPTLRVKDIQVDKVQAKKQKKLDNYLPKDEIPPEQDEKILNLRKLEPKSTLLKADQQDLMIASLVDPGTDNLAENIPDQPRESVDKSENSQVTRKGISLLKIAELGLQVFNKLNETDYEVKPNYTSTGELKSVTLITEERKITAPVI